MDLKAALLQERLDLYVRLRGGFTFPLAGAIWWGAQVLSYAIVRAVAAFALWLLFPDQRHIWVPASVSVVYIATVIAILIDCRRVEATLGSDPRLTPV